VVFGKASGWDSSLDLSTLNGSNGFRLNGVSADDTAGYSVASAGDMNGDGLPDLIIGALRADPNGTDAASMDAGSSYVYFSQASSGATYRGTTLADSLRGTAFADSMNGYAGDDTMNGGAGNDIITGGAGDDLAQLSGAQSNYRFGVCDGVVITSGADGQDHFTAIERFKWGAAADISIASLAASGVNLGLVYSRLGNRDFDYSLPDVYDGPLAGIVNQQINGDTNDIVIATIQADFCNAGAGDDGMDGGGGNDILDGGLGSNFISGGAGLDRFFIDGWAAATAITWSTITDFSLGEQVTIWGYQPGVSKFVWVTSDGVEGFKGATLHCDLDGNGLIDTSLSFTGLSQAQLATPSYGSVDGKDYIFFS
jgi:serralysin